MLIASRYQYSTGPLWRSAYSGPADIKKMSTAVLTEKSFGNLIKSNWNPIAFTIFRLIWNQTDVRLVPNKSENDNYNLILVWFNKISLCALLIVFVKYTRWEIFSETCWITPESDCFYHFPIYLEPNGISIGSKLI